MLFLFGMRSSRIQQQDIPNVSCDYCQQNVGYRVTTFGRYAHLFFIPMFPLGRKTVAECAHCKKTYDRNFPEALTRAIVTRNQQAPSKRPLWHGCGCLIIIAAIALVILTSIFTWIFLGDEMEAEYDKKVADPEYQMFQDDINQLSRPIDTTNEFTMDLKMCMDLHFSDDINVDRIKYVTRINRDKMLILMRFPQMKEYDKESRKSLLELVENCANIMMEKDRRHLFVGIKGTYSPVAYKTPDFSATRGIMGITDWDDLIEFYEDEDYSEFGAYSENDNYDSADRTKNRAPIKEPIAKLIEEDGAEITLWDLMYSTTTKPGEEYRPITHAIEDCFEDQLQYSLDRNDIGYNEAVHKDKHLIMVKIPDIQNVPREARGVIAEQVKDCIVENKLVKSNKLYIVIDGHTDAVAVLTPTTQDYDGIEADKELLYGFFE